MRRRYEKVRDLLKCLRLQCAGPYALLCAGLELLWERAGSSRRETGCVLESCGQGSGVPSVSGWNGGAGSTGVEAHSRFGTVPTSNSEASWVFLGFGVPSAKCSRNVSFSVVSAAPQPMSVFVFTSAGFNSAVSWRQCCHLESCLSERCYDRGHLKVSFSSG